MAYWDDIRDLISANFFEEVFEELDSIIFLPKKEKNQLTQLKGRFYKLQEEDMIGISPSTDLALNKIRWDLLKFIEEIEKVTFEENNDTGKLKARQTQATSMSRRDIRENIILFVFGSIFLGVGAFSLFSIPQKIIVQLYEENVFYSNRNFDDHLIYSPLEDEIQIKKQISQEGTIEFTINPSLKEKQFQLKLTSEDIVLASPDSVYQFLGDTLKVRVREKNKLKDQPPPPIKIPPKCNEYREYELCLGYSKSPPATREIMLNVNRDKAIIVNQLLLYEQTSCDLLTIKVCQDVKQLRLRTSDNFCSTLISFPSGGSSLPLTSTCK